MAELRICRKPVENGCQIGDVIHSRSEYDAEHVWAQVVFRGRYPEGIEFNQKIYHKYFRRFRRVFKFKKPIDTLIENPVCNSEKAGFGFYDKQIKEIPFPLNKEAIEDLNLLLPDLHISGNKKLYQSWPFGEMELKEGFPIYIPDSQFKNMYDVREYMRSNSLEGKRGKRFLFKVDISKNEIIEQAGLNKKVREIKDGNLSESYKLLFDKHSNDTKLIDLFYDYTVKIENDFIPKELKIVCNA